MDANATERESAAPSRRRPARAFATRRRLVVAFSVVLAAFVSALAFQLVALRGMETTLDEMEDHELESRLALELGRAVRTQYAHQERVMLGDAASVARYERAREHALDVTRRLGELLDEPEAIACLEEIREAEDALDRRFREQLVPTSPVADGPAMREHVRRYALVARIEEEVDEMLTELQEAGSSMRAQLVSFQAASHRWTAVLLLVIPAFVAGAVLYLSRSVARPLARLSEGAGAVAAGDLGARIDIDTPDEFGALAGEFNAMTAALREHERRLVEAEKLAGIGRLAAGVAHEINNPLQVMLGYASLHRDVREPRLAGHLAAIEAEAVRCKQVVDGLLELARPSVEPEEVDLRALCEDVADGLRAAGAPRGTTISIAGRARALGSRPKLRQVVFNLVKNAVEAAGPDGDVEVRMAASGGRAELSVSDSGRGIPPEASTKIFEPFFTTKPRGTGLGLAVSRAIALAHGGDIDVQAGDLGGARFTLRVPSAPGGRS